MRKIQKYYAQARLIHDRRGKATNEVAQPVHIEVAYRRERRYLKTGVKLCKNEWDDKHKQVTNRADMYVLNELLQTQMKRVVNFLRDLDIKGIQFTFDRLLDEVESGGRDQTFLDYMAKQIEEREDIRPLTKKAHRSALSLLTKSKAVKWFSDLTPSNMDKFDKYLRSIGERQTTISKQHKRIKVYVNMAVRDGLIDESPYTKMKISAGKPKPFNYLTDEEMRTLRTGKIGVECLEKVRDLAVLQMYTGLAYADLYKCKWEIEHRGNLMCVRDNRQKSDEEYFFVLLKPALEVLKKYDFKLPKISNQQYNMRLKLVGVAVGIDKPMASHMMRRTFATWALSNGLTIEQVSRALGHTNIRTTQIYARVLSKDLENAMAELNNKIQ